MPAAESRDRDSRVRVSICLNAHKKSLDFVQGQIFTQLLSSPALFHPYLHDSKLFFHPTQGEKFANEKVYNGMSMLSLKFVNKTLKASCNCATCSFRIISHESPQKQKKMATLGWFLFNEIEFRFI